MKRSLLSFIVLFSLLIMLFLSPSSIITSKVSAQDESSQSSSDEQQEEEPEDEPEEEEEQEEEQPEEESEPEAPQPEPPQEPENPPAEPPQPEQPPVQETVVTEAPPVQETSVTQTPPVAATTATEVMVTPAATEPPATATDATSTETLIPSAEETEVVLLEAGAQAVQTFCQLEIDDRSDNDPFTYHFAAVNTSGIASYSWSFGDGNTAGNVQSVNHDYGSTGSFTVTLTCIPDAGSNLVLRGTIQINSAPTASFALTPGTVFTGLPPFTISTVNSSKGSDLTYSWKVSDSSNVNHPGLTSGNSKDISYTFNDYGTYWFHLIVTDRTGVNSLASQSVVFNAPPPAANFNLSPADGTSPLTVSVEGVDLGEGPITSWTFDFGDGSPVVTGQGPHSHTYTLADPDVAETFLITLNYDGPGGAGSYGREVGVYPLAEPVDANFTWESRGNVPGGVDICFTNISTGPVAFSYWDFEGDGTYETMDNAAVVCHTYATDGMRTVRLLVENSDGTSTSTASDVVDVNASPVASFTITPGANITWGTLIDLDSTSSTGIITSWSWDFNGDGIEDSDAQNPSDISLTTLGNNPIRLTVSGPGGTSYAEQVIFVARLDITCDFTGTLNVLPTATAQTYQSVIGNINGRDITYSWTITGDSAGLPMTFATDAAQLYDDITVDWASIGAGTFVVTLTAETADGSSCSETKTVTRAWRPLDCQISATLPSPMYATGTTYTFTANVGNLDGRDVLGYRWFIDGVEQPGETGPAFQRSWSTAPASDTTEVIRYEVLVDDGNSLTSNCYEERSVTINAWPNLVCTSISGNANPIPGLPDSPNRSYTYTATATGIAGRTVTYTWTYTPANLISQTDNQINLTWPETVGSIAPGTAQSVSVSVTVTNLDGTTDDCTMTQNLSVQVPRLTCDLPIGDINPVLNETGTYTINLANQFARTLTNIGWELEQSDGTGGWIALTTGTADPFSYLFDVPDTQYRLRYTASVSSPDDNCISQWLTITVNTSGVNFFCDAFPTAGNNFSPPSASTNYAYRVDMDNGNNIALHYTWVLVGPGSTERILGTSTSSGNGIIVGPSFSGALFGPVDNYTLRVDVRAVNDSDSSAPGYSTYRCSLSRSLTVGTLTVNYTYANSTGGAVNANAVEVGQVICLDNTSTTSHSDINGMSYVWDFGTANTSLGATSTTQEPGCFSFTNASGAGGYTVRLTGTSLDLNGNATSRNANRAYTFYVYGSQSIAINRSNQVFAPNTLNFQAVGTNITGSYTWRFIRLSDNQQVGAPNGQNVSQFFNTAGSYRAIVTGTGPLGTTTAQVEFTLLGTNQLRASFTPSVYGGIAPMTVCFTDRSVSGTGYPIQTWEWDFGNGQTVSYNRTNIPSSLCTTYTQASTRYTVRLRVNNGALTETATNTVRTYSLLESSASFSITPSGSAQYCYTAQLVGDVSVTGWDYGDGGVGGQQNTVCHTYGASGSYLVEMRIRNNTTGETGTVVRTVNVTLTGGSTPNLRVTGTCSADRTATFRVTNSGGAMTTPDQVTIFNNAGTAIRVDSLMLGNGEYRDYIITDQSGTVTFRTNDSNLTASTDCEYPPAIRVVATCTGNLATFTIYNDDGPMTSTQAYTVRNSAGTQVRSGSFQMARNATPIVVTVPGGSNPYDTYTFQSSGSTGTFSVAHNCATQPALSITGICAGDVTFTITNSSSHDMVTPQTFTISNTAGDDVTPVNNSFQLVAGGSRTITLTGLDPYAGYTLTTHGFTGNYTRTQDCNRPIINVTSACAEPIVFTITNTGGDMLSAQSFRITNAAGDDVTPATNTFQLGNGESTTIRLIGRDPYAGYTLTTNGFAGDDTQTQNCAQPNFVVTSVCADPVAFVIVNTGADMLDGQRYSITNAQGNLVRLGLLNLGSGESVTISLTGLNPYDEYTLQSDGFAGTIQQTQNCSRPALVVSSTCSNPVEFVITNNGSDMLTPQSFTVTDASGDDVTPSSSSFQLISGESFTVTLDEELSSGTYTLKTTGFAGSVSKTQNCGSSKIVVSTICETPVGFTIANIGSDMLTDGTFTMTTISGDNLTPSNNTFRLESGESLRVNVPDGTDTTEGILFTTTVTGVTTSAVMRCSETTTLTTVIPTPLPGGDFSGLSDDLLNLPPWAQVSTCSIGCPTWRLYHTDETGDWEIFRLDGASSETRQTMRVNLSHGEGEGVDDMSPSRSPNEAWIVFTSNRDTLPDQPENWEIYVAPSNGDANLIQRVTYNSIALDTNPVWGPHNYIVYQSTRNGNWDLYLMDMSTGIEYQLTSEESDEINPNWSPDGSRIIFQSNQDGLWQLYLLDLLTLTTRRLSDGTRTDVDGQFSPDGTRIAYRSYSEADGNSTIYVMNLNGENAFAVTEPEDDATNQAWSPTGRLIAYQAERAGQLDVYVYDTITRTERQLTNSSIKDYAPTWLCNDEMVVFTSDEAGSPDIYQVGALPITAPSIEVVDDAEQLTFEDFNDIYPQNMPPKEFASREGQTVIGEFGEQTEFLLPDTQTTNVDLSLDDAQREDWQTLESCPVADKP
jgi:Tol biopolymer transport system component/PKD repeat protein